MTLAAAQILTPDALQAVRRRSDLRGLWCVVHAWLVIFGCMAALSLFPHPAVWAAGIVIVGARQLGLAVLMHDAAHGILTRSARLNVILGQYFCAWPVITDIWPYRSYHLKHHRHTQQAQDPDLVLSAPFPITPSSFRRKVVRDITGQTTFKQRVAQFRAAFRSPDGTWDGSLRRGLQRLGGPIAVNAALLAGLAAIGQWHLYVALWLVPFFTWFPLVTRIRNIAEHAVVPDNDDPFRQARTTRANLLWRATVAPYWVNYHVEHHLMMYVPCYNLPKLHAMLLAKGLGPRMEIQPGYIAVLRMAVRREAAVMAPAGAAAADGGDGIAFNITPRRDGAA